MALPDPEGARPSRVAQEAAAAFDAATYAAHLEAVASRQPSAPAISAPGLRPTTFAELVALASTVRAQFDAWDIGPGDVVVWPAIDRVASAAALAIVPACATLMPLAPRLTVDAYERAFARTKARALVVPAAQDHPAAEAARRRGIALIACAPYDEGGAGAFRLALADEGSAPREATSVVRDTLLVVLTSGTTGRPKLVPAAWGALSVTMREMGRRLDLGPDDVSGHLTTLHLANGLRNAGLLALVHGGSIRVLPEGDVDAFARAASAGEITFASASFTILRELLRRLDDGMRFERGRLRFLRVSSGRLEPGEMERLEAHLGVPVVTGLSTSETGTVAQQELPRDRRERGSVGRPLAVEIRVVDERNVVLPQGAVGEVQVRGPQVFDGYLDDPALDAAAFDGDWFRSGDLGRFDERGELHLVGRLKETINRGGEKIAPLEIDEVLRTAPGVADAAAFGVPHPALGEEVVAAVVRTPGATVDASALIARVRAALGERRAPRRIWFVDELPRTATGKLLRSALPDRVGVDEPAGASAPEGAGARELAPLELALAALWNAALRRASIGRDENFFLLGGDSLRGANLFAQVRAVFGVDLPLQALFEDAGTVAGMARRIEAARGGS